VDLYQLTVITCHPNAVVMNLQFAIRQEEPLVFTACWMEFLWRSAGIGFALQNQR